MIRHHFTGEQPVDIWNVLSGRGGGTEHHHG